MERIRRKSLDRPDERRQIEHGIGEITRLGAFAIGRAVLEPGWRWSTHMQPAMGTPSCPVHHIQLHVSGRFAIRMDGGEEVELGPGDVADVPPGHDAWVVGDEPAVILDFAGNVDAVGVPPERERVITTLLMTDIVDSTAIARRLGDAAWRQVLSDHNRVVRTLLGRFGGTEVSTTGDGFVARFASAVAALRCARALCQAIADAGVEIRAAVHTGEVEEMGDDIGGIAVHAVSRILSLAGPSEVLTSGITVGLIGGSDLAFEDRGAHEVKGFDRPIEVYRLS